MIKFDQDHHQMSLAGDPRSDVQGRALYSEVYCIMGNGHTGIYTHTCENITFPQLRWRADMIT